MVGGRSTLPNPASATSSRKNDLFISYAREDIEFVQKLDFAIRSLGRDPWIDLDDLPFSPDRSESEEWQYLEDGIKQAEGFVFVISPASVKSPKNQQQLQTAIQHGKPLIPVLCRAVEPLEHLPDEFPQTHWISIDSAHPESGFAWAAQQVIQYPIYDKLRLRAEQWQQNSQAKEFLLYADDVASVKAWAQENTAQANKLQLTALQQQYVEASAQAIELRQVQNPDVFISYSRRDKPLVERLTQALKQHQVQVWIDWERIPVAAPWREKLTEGIQDADSLLFVMSQNSVASDYCREEIKQADQDNKRIISAVLDSSYDREQVPKAARERNWIYLNKYEDDFDAFVADIVKAIKTDEKYVKEHTKLLTQAHDWDSQNRSEEALLRGSKLRSAINWLNGIDAATQEKDPQPTHLQREFIQASKKHQGRTRLTQGLGVGIAAVTILGFLAATVLKTVGEINALVSSLETRQELDALMVSMKAGRDLRSGGLSNLLRLTPFDPTVKVVNALNKSIANLNEQNRLEKHQERIHRVSFMGQGDEQLLASASEDGTVRLWTADGTPSQLPLYGHRDKVVALNIDPAGQKLVSASYDKTIKLWEISREPDGTPKGSLIRTLTDPSLIDLSHDDWIYDVRFSPDGQKIASASIDGTIKIWSDQGFYRTTLTTNSENISVSFGKSGKTLASASQDGLRTWTGQDLSQAKQLDTNPAFWVRASPNGEQFVSSGGGNTVKLWGADGRLIHELKGHSARIHRAIFSHGGKLIATASADNTVKVWDAATGAELRTLRGHQDQVYRVEFSADDRMIVSGGRDDTVRLWQPTSRLGAGSQDSVEFWKTDSDDDALIKTLVGHRNEIMDLSFSEDGKLIASASSDATIKLWQTQQGAVRLRNDQGLESGAVLSQQGQFLVAGSSAKLFFWQQVAPSLEAGSATLPNWQPLATISKAGGEGFLKGISLSPDNRLLAGINDVGKIRLWRLKLNSAGQIQLPIAAPAELRPSSPKSSLISLRFSPDGQFLATGSEDSTIQLWQFSPSNSSADRNALPKPIASFTPGNGNSITSLDFHSKAQLLVAAGRARNSQPDAPQTLTLWDISNPQAPQKLRLAQSPQLGSITSVRFSPDGKFLAVALESDNSIRLLKLSQSGSQANQTRSLQEVGEPMRGHRAPVVQLAYSSLNDRTDNYLLASASRDTTVKLWSKMGKPIAQPIEHRRAVQSVLFDEANKQLISASLDREVQIYELPSDSSDKALNELLDEGCHLLSDHLRTNLNNVSNDQETAVLMQQTAEFCKPQSKSPEESPEENGDQGK
ncbi:MAG: TIR domain-containing protein [Pegethrix bostrychoides GSE-TBD4-15B]|jgi:WD40 repeat protein|uniref:TIR domain-containing protein n=1 Tax=Pegethrix bostrychoides GSE-TBD4-15B TaxID=2839662 RepID=A0A951PCL3_9CYAN|nr:TIR domain-containing protein [Pegethrix bostrychoides GSE-TBD4-15B]